MTGNSDNILEINSIEVMYDSVISALHDVSLNVPRGKIVALLGGNGAGKSTTLKSISTMLAAERGKVTKGSILYDGTEVKNQSPYEMVALGMVQVLEGRRCFGHLTVEENIQLAQIAEPIGWGIERIYDLFPRLGERRKQEGITLSGGEQQMLSIGRALARDIKVLLLDEPYEGLAPVIVDEIEKTLNVIKEQGITTVIVEQNAVRALELADRSVILDTGGVVFDGRAKEVLDNSELRAEYLAI